MEPSTTLKGRYKIERELGRGGMGIVYLAQDQELLSRPVVVKVLFDEVYRDEVLRRKFRQEMEALTRMDHPGVVGILDAGEMPDGKPFLVMQFIEGVSLHSILSPDGMELDRVASLLQQIGAALNAAHEKGIFHRDLKPQNIMIQNFGRPNERVKIIDFGLAKVADSRIAESTHGGGVIGSYGYISPEQLTAKPVSAASDVYSLTVIAFEMITGRRPFNPDSVFELYDLQRSGPSKMPRSYRPDLSEQAETVLMKGLSFDPANRYATADEFCEQLSLALRLPGSIKPAPVTLKRKETSALLFVFSSIALLFCSVIFWKSYTGRFMDWTSFLSQPSALVIVLTLIPYLVGFFVERTRKALVAFHAIATILLLVAIVRIPDVFRFETTSSIPENGFSLNYSDPKGYKYTLVDRSSTVITIFPGGWNRLSDYRIELKLSPKIEFADVFFDKNFNLRGQLSLQPSNTNDILLVQKHGDHFTEARRIRFTYKYRTYHQSNSVRIALKTGNKEISAEKEIVIPPTSSGKNAQ